MTLTPAPLFTDVAPGPETGAAFWARTSDNLRIRIGVWPKDGARGTVLIFPGRTEYIEKYGQAAQEFANRGYASMAIDWRGQGLADRMLSDVRIGHVQDFKEYQKDVAEMVTAAKALDLPRPYFLLAHSMGGAIGLRAVVEGLDATATAFSAPMWGVRIAPHLKPMALVLGKLMPAIGQGHRLPPTLKPEPYVLVEPFEDNMLTTDRPMFEMMQAQLAAHPELSLGGPSFVWLNEALSDTLDLAGKPAPNLPCATFLGRNERIIDVTRIHKRMETWENGKLIMVDDAEHEVMMESPDTRKSVFDSMAKLFDDAQ